MRILIDTDTAQADLATFSGWIDRDTGAACDVRLWDDDDVLAQLTAAEPVGYDAA